MNSCEGKIHDFLSLMKKLNLVKLKEKCLNFEFGIFLRESNTYMMSYTVLFVKKKFIWNHEIISFIMRKLFLVSKNDYFKNQKLFSFFFFLQESNKYNFESLPKINLKTDHGSRILKYSSFHFINYLYLCVPKSINIKRRLTNRHFCHLRFPNSAFLSWFLLRIFIFSKYFYVVS